MRNLIKTLILAGLLLVPTLAPVSAQTNGSSQPGARTAEMERRMALDKLEADAKKLEMERRMALDRLEANTKRLDIAKDMIHDLAWNSWVLAVIAFFFFRHLGRKAKYETIRQMVDKGVPVTPEVLAGLKTRERMRSSRRDPQGYFAWGITLVAVGAGLLMIAGKVGWIVLLIGVADLILYAVDRGNNNGNGAQPK